METHTQLAQSGYLTGTRSQVSRNGYYTICHTWEKKVTIW